MSFHYDKFARLKKFTDSVGEIYGTEDFALYLYSIVKMTKPTSVLELGTGLGTTMAWIAMALDENKSGGILHTVDDGSEWNSIKASQYMFNEHYDADYAKYIDNIITSYNFGNVVKFHNELVDHFNFNDKYDLVFSDFSHGPFFIVKLLSNIIPKMSDNSYIMIDSASTLYSSYHTLESLIDYMNSGKIPRTLLELSSTPQKLYEKVVSSKFELTHIIENKNRDQNSTAQIKISPVDIIPQPRNNIRF